MFNETILYIHNYNILNNSIQNPTPSHKTYSLYKINNFKQSNLIHFNQHIDSRLVLSHETVFSYLHSFSHIYILIDKH